MNSYDRIYNLLAEAGKGMMARRRQRRVNRKVTQGIQKRREAWTVSDVKGSRGPQKGGKNKVDLAHAARLRTLANTEGLSQKQIDLRKKLADSARTTGLKPQYKKGVNTRKENKAAADADEAKTLKASIELQKRRAAQGDPAAQDDGKGDNKAPGRRIQRR